jgi:hypothetical protein
MKWRHPVRTERIVSLVRSAPGSEYIAKAAISSIGSFHDIEGDLRQEFCYPEGVKREPKDTLRQK